jgi:hypothetical protein
LGLGGLLYLKKVSFRHTPTPPPISLKKLKKLKTYTEKDSGTTLHGNNPAVSFPLSPPLKKQDGRKERD